MAPKKASEEGERRKTGRPKKKDTEAKKAEQPEEEKKGAKSEIEKKQAGIDKVDSKPKASKTKEQNSKEEKTDAGKRKKDDGDKAEGGKKAKKASGQAPGHGQEQVENPVHTITNPKEVPKGVSRDKRGRLVFEGFDDFRPTLTPKQVIQAGSFGGIYFNPTGGKKSVKYPNGCDISADEFPKDWFEGLRDEQYKGKRYNVKLNKYGVKSGQNQEQWEEQGWIRDQDQRGWFQWYCRFTQGRRTDDDKRQIERWRGVAGEKGRFKKRLVNMVKDKGGKDYVQDASISPVIRQNLLHWAYELTPQDFEALVSDS